MTTTRETNPKTGLFPWAPEPIRRVAGRLKFEVAEARWRATDRGRRNARALAGLRGACAGRRAFVIGNGPSLNRIDLGRLEGEVTIGSNGIFLKQEDGFTPTYFTVEDWLVAEQQAERIAAYRGPTKVLPRVVSRWIDDDDDIVWANFLYAYRGFPRFSDAFDRCSYWGGTVTYFNLQLARYLGCSSAILVGVDHNWKMPDKVPDNLVLHSDAPDSNHFDPRYFGPGTRWHSPVMENMNAAYACAREFSRRSGWPILNATVGGHLEVFPRVDFDDLFPKRHR